MPSTFSRRVWTSSGRLLRKRIMMPVLLSWNSSCLVLEWPHSFTTPPKSSISTWRFSFWNICMNLISTTSILTMLSTRQRTTELILRWKPKFTLIWQVKKISPRRRAFLNLLIPTDCVSGFSSSQIVNSWIIWRKKNSQISLIGSLILELELSNMVVEVLETKIHSSMCNTGMLFVPYCDCLTRQFCKKTSKSRDFQFCVKLQKWKTRMMTALQLIGLAKIG